MADDTQKGGTQSTGGTGFTPITTQEDFDKAFNRIFADKIGRERDKFADYNDLKAKAAELDALKEQGQTELQKAEARATKAEAELKTLKADRQIEAWKTEVSEVTGVKASLLSGTTKEEIEKHAQAIKETYKLPAAPVVGSEGRKPATPGKSPVDQFGEVLDRLG